jgi:hypothetical protein
MKKWQPISTAPKDNRSLLLWDGHIVFVAHFMKLGSGHGYWIVDGIGGYDLETEHDEPTHWMALPEPPK